MEDLKLELKNKIIEVLNLEDVAIEEIKDTDPLFGGGLGLDSIDALEIALAISQKYGVQMQADDQNTRSAFANLASLTDFVKAHATK
ncbi:MAG: acyl carrier protein [Moraxellaceae bacterium]|nr:MAG: acyl carrier protein [Moraxellaceae bacterium]